MKAHYHQKHEDIWHTTPQRKMQVLGHERGWSSEGHNVEYENGKWEKDYWSGVKDMAHHCAYMKREDKVGRGHSPHRNVVKGRKDMREGNEKDM